MEPDEIPFVTADQMREVDRAMIEEYEIDLAQMMELAGRQLAALSRSEYLEGDPTDRSVLVLAGTGGNGGGGMVAARRLHGWGAEVELRTTRGRGEYEGVSGRQLRSLDRIGVPIMEEHEGLPTAEEDEYDLVVDAVVGYGLTGAPYGAAGRLVRWANRSSAPTLSLDIPSGIEATEGHVLAPAVEADATMTLALPKTGLRAEEARSHVGALFLADIGVPPELYREGPLALQIAPVFTTSDLRRIW